MNKENFYKILEGVLLLFENNEFVLINLGYTDEEIRICSDLFEKIVTLKLK